jgi:hypothetical protein
MSTPTSRDEQVLGWFAGRVPDGWFIGPPEVRTDRDEIWVVGSLADPDLGDDPSDDARQAARASRIQGFREDTRRDRMSIADEAQRAFGRRVSWGATCGDVTTMFTVQAVPAMTRLRLPEREVLDTLVEAGVARSRSHALAWCVRLVASNQERWIGDLREALKGVEQIRTEGPVGGPA